MVSKSKETKTPKLQEIVSLEELEAVYASRDRAISAALDYWQKRVSLEVEDRNIEKPVRFPESIDVIIDTAALIEEFYDRGRNIRG